VSLDNGSCAPDAGHEAEEVVLDSTLSAVELEEEVVTAPISGEPEAVKDSADVDGAAPTDPTFRIGRLPAANKKLVVVNQNDWLTKAISFMLKHDFSQLPVMQGEREVKGMITWKSIGSRFAFGCKCDLVSDCREDAQVVNSDRTLFGSIPTIVEHGYVLVRDRVDRKITGIVTASDLSLEFQLLSEPFLLLREIELHVRKLLAGKIGGEDFGALANDAPPMPTPKNIAELTFGQYVRLVQHPKIWPKLNLKIDPGVLANLLEEVRLIRNDVMHFDPDPMTGDELDKLKQAVNFMQRIQELLQ
jgi:CBS domain-containing protein